MAKRVRGQLPIPDEEEPFEALSEEDDDVMSKRRKGALTIAAHTRRVEAISSATDSSNKVMLAQARVWEKMLEIIKIQTEHQHNVELLRMKQEHELKVLSLTRQLP